MEAGDIGTEPEPDGSGSPEEFGENVEVDSAAIEQETQDFQDNLGSVGGDAAEDQKKKM